MLTRKRACEQLQNFAARASERPCNFCEHFYIEWDHSIPLLNSGITLQHFDISLLKYNSRGWALIKAVQNDFENLLSCFLCCVAVGDHSRGQNDDSNAKFSLKNSPSDTNEINK